ncbi:MAG: type VI secretion system protein TssA [Planctomycetes bacterium]|nr:type VI secretion system protein TssA [Planctomycetota bacterium]
MNSPDTIDFDTLLRPIEGDLPAGQDLRSDPSPVSLYYQIKDARAAARAAERSGMQFEDGQQVVGAEWRSVLRLGPEILATKSKDLEITAWLIEALVREYGFAGLRDGFRLAREMVERFWDGLYPMPDEDGISTRVAPLAGLNGGESEGTLAVPIALAAITEEGEYGAYGLWRYSKARESSKAGASGEGLSPMAKFEATVRNCSPDFFRSLVGDVEAAIEHFAALTALLDERCGSDSPPSSAIRRTLEEAKQTITHVVQSVAGVMIDSGEAEAAPIENEAEVASGPTVAAPAAAPGEIRTRDDAFRVLSRVADYFRDQEPHSPLSSLLYQAVRWGRLPLRQLIEELFPDSSARDHFGLLTGLGGRSAEDDDG